MRVILQTLSDVVFIEKDMNQTRYTFLLPAYKPDFFEEALRSIKSQTLKDFKVLVSDDCSPHDLKSIFDKICGDDERFAYRRNEENMGGKSLVSHWNLLVDMCDTEYLILASDDDVYEPTFLEEVDKLAVKYPVVDLIRARVRAIDDHGELIEKDAIYEEYADDLEFLKQKHFNNALRCIANYVFRTSGLKKHGGFVEFPLAWYSDDATVMMMSENGAANTNGMLLNFRSSSISISSRKLNKADAYKKALATIFFKRWFQDNIVPRLNSRPQTEYVRRIRNFVTHAHGSFMHQMFSYFSSNCRFSDFWKLLFYFDSKKMRLRLLYNYLRAKMIR